MSSALRPPSSALPARLPQVLGRVSAIAMVVGSIIGSGIFTKPATIAQNISDFWLIAAVWIGMGLVTLCGALAVAELAAMLPRAGGPYVYLREAFGPGVAFLWGWAEFWIMRTGSLGALAAASALYAGQLVPLTLIQQGLLAMALVAVLTAATAKSTQGSASVQNAMTVVKVGFLLLIIIAGLLLAGDGAQRLATPGAPPAGGLWVGLGMALVAVLWPYDGWINLAPLAEEVRQPERNVPFALIGGMWIVIGLYVLANLAYHLTLSHAEIAASSAVAADACGKLFGPVGRTAVSLGVMCSTFGAVNANLLTGPRIYFAMARDGLLPPSLARVHARNKTPANAIWLQGGWALLLIAAAYGYTIARGATNPLDAFNTLTNFVIFGASLFYALAVAAVFVLRRTHASLPRPYKTWLYPWTPVVYLLAFVAAIVSLLATSPLESAVGVALILAGWPCYWKWARHSQGSRI